MYKVDIIEQYKTTNGLIVAVRNIEEPITVQDIITDGQKSYKVLSVQFPTTPNSDEDVYIMLGVKEVLN